MEKKKMKKLLSIITLLVLLVGSAFATNWKKYGTYKDECGDAYEVYFDYDATEPFELEKEDIRYLRNLSFYYNVSIGWLKYYDDQPYAKGAKHNCYSTFVLYGDVAYEYHVNKDGTITEYHYEHNGDTFYGIMEKLSIDVFETPWVIQEKEDK